MIELPEALTIAQQMDDELKMATPVHARLVPKSLTTESADIAFTYLPVYYLGGDYANFQITDGKNLIFFICDVTGHGVSAALLVNAIRIWR